MSRCNGHRGKFKVGKEDQSALSHHIFEKPLDFPISDQSYNFGQKLENFKFGVVQQVDPRQLDRVEDYYVYSTNADIYKDLIQGLNRYLVARLRLLIAMSCLLLLFQFKTM